MGKEALVELCKDKAGGVDKIVASHQEGSCLSQLEPGNSGYLAKTCVLD